MISHLKKLWESVFGKIYRKGTIFGSITKQNEKEVTLGSCTALEKNYSAWRIRYANAKNVKGNFRV